MMRIADCSGNLIKLSGFYHDMGSNPSLIARLDRINRNTINASLPSKDFFLCDYQFREKDETLFHILFQGLPPTDYNELINLVSAQQATLQSQQSEIRQVSKCFLLNLFLVIVILLLLLLLKRRY